jgi:hypothetical protein
MISHASTSRGPLRPASITRSVNPRAEPRSRRRTSAFRWRSARCADNKQEPGDSLFVPRSSEQKAVMPSLTLRGTANVVACLVVRPVGESQPTARWQDKSCKLRRGRWRKKLRCIKHALRGATETRSLSICITHCDFTTTRGSHTPAS